MYMYVNGVCTSFMYVYTPTMYRRGVSFQVAPTTSELRRRLMSGHFMNPFVPFPPLLRPPYAIADFTGKYHDKGLGSVDRPRGRSIVDVLSGVYPYLAY